MEASGKETRGAGTASATVRASLEPSGDDATAVTMHTTMNVTGRPAQFGRGVMVEVGGKLVEQFAQNLAQLITTDFATDKGSAEESTDQSSGAGSDAADSADADATTGSDTTGAGSNANGTGMIAADGTTASSAPAPAPAPAPPAADHINMIRLVGPSLLKRIVPVAAIAAGLALLGRRFWHRAHKGTGA